MLSQKRDITKQNLIRTVTPAILKAFSSTNILSGFRKSGLIPLSVDAILSRLQVKKQLWTDVKQRKQQVREQSAQLEASESKSASSDSKEDVAMAPAETKSTSAKDILKVPEFSSKRKRGGRPSKFPHGADLTADHIMQRLEREQAERDAQGKKSKKSPVAWLVIPETGKVYGQGYGKRKPGRPARKKRRASAAETKESEAEEQTESEASESDSDSDEETSEDETAAGAMETDFKTQDAELADSEHSDSDRSDDDEQMCAWCSGAITRDMRCIPCSGDCGLVFHLGCTNLGRSAQFQANPKFLCKACSPAASGLSLI